MRAVLDMLPRAQRTTIAGFAIIALGCYLLIVGKLSSVEFGGFVALAAPFLGINEHSVLPVVETRTGEAVVTTPAQSSSESVSRP